MFFVKTTKNICKKFFFLLNYILKNVLQRFFNCFNKKTLRIKLPAGTHLAQCRKSKLHT
jgi:hypothetical protein